MKTIKELTAIKPILENIIYSFVGKENTPHVRARMNEELYRILCGTVADKTIDNFTVYVGPSVVEVNIQAGSHYFPVTHMLQGILQPISNGSKAAKMPELTNNESQLKIRKEMEYMCSYIPHVVTKWPDAKAPEETKDLPVQEENPNEAYDRAMKIIK